jgi:uncharacterized protein YciI
MSTSLRTFILYAPDKTDEGTFALRMSVRPNHLVVANKMLTSGTLSGFYILAIKPGVDCELCAEHAGAMQDPDSEKMVGSMIIYEAESLDAARKLVENDIYYTSGVVSHLPVCQIRSFSQQTG